MKNNPNHEEKRGAHQNTANRYKDNMNFTPNEYKTPQEKISNDTHSTENN
jgi:hypothetical protein